MRGTILCVTIPPGDLQIILFLICQFLKVCGQKKANSGLAGSGFVGYRLPTRPPLHPHNSLETRRSTKTTSGMCQCTITFCQVKLQEELNQAWHGRSTSSYNYPFSRWWISAIFGWHLILVNQCRQLKQCEKQFFKINNPYTKHANIPWSFIQKIIKSHC